MFAKFAPGVLAIGFFLRVAVLSRALCTCKCTLNGCNVCTWLCNLSMDLTHQGCSRETTFIDFVHHPP